MKNSCVFIIFYYHGSYSPKCNAFIIVEICFLSQLSHGNFKTDSQTQIPNFKRNPKDKGETQNKQNHQNKTKTHQPAHSPQNNLKYKTPNMWIPVQHTQNYLGWKGLQEGEA